MGNKWPYIIGFLVPGRPQAYISGGQPSLVLFGFWQDWRTHVSLFSQMRITDLVPDLIQNLSNFKAFEMIGTMYHKYHCPALIIIFYLSRSSPKDPANLKSGTRMSYTDLCMPNQALQKWPIGAPRLNLVPTNPKLYKVAMHHVLVGIPTYKVTTQFLSWTPRSPQQLTQCTQHIHCISRF